MHQRAAAPVVARAEEGAPPAGGVEGLGRGRLGRCVGLRAWHVRRRCTGECGLGVGHERLASPHLRPRPCWERLLPLHLRWEVGMRHPACSLGQQAPPWANRAVRESPMGQGPGRKVHIRLLGRVHFAAAGGGGGDDGWWLYNLETFHGTNAEEEAFQFAIVFPRTPGSFLADPRSFYSRDIVGAHCIILRGLVP